MLPQEFVLLYPLVQGYMTFRHNRNTELGEAKYQALKVKITSNFSDDSAEHVLALVKHLGVPLYLNSPDKPLMQQKGCIPFAKGKGSDILQFWPDWLEHDLTLAREND